MEPVLLQTDGPGDRPGPGVGAHWTTVDTPALLVDLDRLDANLAGMAAHARAGGVALRPHAKTHKSVAIARRQLAHGAVGTCAATLDEASVLLAAEPAASVLMSTEVVAEPKLHRAIDLAARGPLIVAVDDPVGAANLAAVAAAAGVTLEVWIEIDCGLRRCGIAPVDAPALATAIAAHPALRLTGVFTHAGQAYGASGPAEVEAIAATEARSVIEAATAVRAAGIAIEHVSAGSTPTARFLRGDGGLTEIRPGTYAFYDALQVALGTVDERRCALTVAATVISRPAPDRAVIDAGSKTFALDRGAHSSTLLGDYGRLVGVAGSLARLSEEHGMLSIPADSPLAVGDRIRVVPNHVCSVANLGRAYHATRGDRVEEVIAIDAAGGVR